MLDLHLVVADPRLEVVDLKSEVPERRSGGIRPNLTPADGDHSYSIPEFYDAERILSSPPLGKERSG